MDWNNHIRWALVCATLIGLAFAGAQCEQARLKQQVTCVRAPS